MAEYVDKEKLQKDFIEHFCNGTNYVFIFIDDILKFIDDEPTADVAEVKHGKWIKYPRPHYFKCSVCKYTVPYRKAYLHDDGKREYNFCPNCGAKMNLED